MGSVLSANGHSEYESIDLQNGTKIFPSNHTIKQQQAIPAHLNASDEELCLFLQTPPSPPIPFYPSSVSFKSDRKNVKKQRKSSKKRRFEEENNAYFAAPNEIN